MYDKMKIKYFAIPEFKVDEYSVAIRSKLDYYRLLFKSIQLILVSRSTKKANNVIVLYVDKTSRLIYQTTTRLFSINFPFSIVESDDGIEIHLQQCKIDSYMCSLFIGLLNDEFANMEELIDKIYDIDVPSCKVEEVIEILSKLNNIDSGYVRFDDDAAHEKGKKHPKYHFDFFFDTATNVKIGFTEKASLKQFIDMLDLSTNCWYLKDKLK